MYGFVADVELLPIEHGVRVIEDAVALAIGETWKVGVREHKRRPSARPRRTDALIMPPGDVEALSIGAAWDQARVLSRALGGEVVPMFDRIVPDVLDAAPPEGTGDPRWCLQAMGVIDAAGVRLGGGAGVLIGHPDTGYTASPELFDGTPHRLETARGYDYLDDDDDPTDLDRGGPRLFGHGTGTASVLFSGDGDVWGVASEARLVPFRVAPSPVLLMGRHRVALARAIHHAVELGCQVVSISMGNLWGGSALRKAVQRAERAGVIVVAAAGQLLHRPPIRTPIVVAPASYPEVVAAAACDVGRRGCGWSARGKAVAVTAYGEAVWKALAPSAQGPSAEPSWGTSYATAHVAGVAALWIERWKDQFQAVSPELRRAAFCQAMRAAGLPAVVGGRVGEWGAGVLDAVKVLAVPPSTAVDADLTSQAPTDSPNVEELARILDVPPEQTRNVRDAVERLFRTEPGGVEAFLGEHGPELTDHLTREMPAGIVLRDAALESSSAAGVGLLPGSGFLRDASTELRSRLRPSVR